MACHAWMEYVAYGRRLSPCLQVVREPGKAAVEIWAPRPDPSRLIFTVAEAM